MLGEPEGVGVGILGGPGRNGKCDNEEQETKCEHGRILCKGSAGAREKISNQ
jgi:hypothetical protein